MHAQFLMHDLQPEVDWTACSIIFGLPSDNSWLQKVCISYL